MNSITPRRPLPPAAQLLSDGAAASPRRRRLLMALSGAALPATALPGLARAQGSQAEYPSRPVRVIVAFAPGSLTDGLVRLLGPRMSQVLGTSIVVDNKPGATGIIGTQMAAQAAPDGYTLVMGGVSSHGALPALMPNLPYDALKDFTPIGLATAPPALIAVHPSVPASNIKEFAAWTQQQPGGVSYATTGVGSSGHLTTELLVMQTGARLVPVPYKDAGQAIADLISGQVKMLVYYAPMLPHIRAGRLKALAVLSEQRVDFASEIPTAAEQGFPKLLSSGWTGLFGPAGLPDPVRDKLQAALAAALADAGIREQLAKQGQVPLPLGPAQFRQFVQAEIAKWSEVVRIANIKVS